MNTVIYDEDTSLLLDAILANAYDALLQLDLISGEAYTIYAADPAWQKTKDVRFDFERMIERYILDHSIDPNPDEIIARLKIAQIGAELENHNRLDLYFTMRDTDGAVALKALSFCSAGVSQALMTMRDITKDFTHISNNLQHLESSLRTTASQIEERNVFLTLLSRNLRTPLHSIMGLTQIARNPHEITNIDAYLQKISSSGSYMSETLDDILDLRRISRGEISLRPEPICIGTFLEQLSGPFAQITADQGYFFQLQAEEASSLQIMADMHSLRQILLKLLSCSTSYTSRGGRLTLNIRPLTIQDAHVSLAFSVDSRGITLDQERLANLFKPCDLFRNHVDADLSTLDIALVILKSYALALGASTLVAESDETHGTRISVTLDFPLVDTEDTADTPSGPSELSLPDFTGKRVLVVDDNMINLEVTAKILTAHEFSVVNAVDGQDAIRCYREANGQFDIILMDILMPVIDGLEATKAIRKMSDIPGSDHIPIVAMTANAFREDFEESLRSGIDAHLVKPIDPNRLLGIIAVLLHLQ